MPRLSPLLSRRTLMAAASAAGMAGLAAPAFAQGSTAPKPMDWVKPPVIRMVRLSPDGARNASLTEENGQKSLVSFNVATGKAGRIDIGDVQVEDMFWVGNSHVCVVTLIPERRMRPGAGPGSFRLANIYNIDQANRILVFEAVAKLQAGVVSGKLFPIERKGKAMLAAASRFGPEQDFAYLYAIDPDTGKGELLDRGPRETNTWLVAPDGTPVARSAYNFRIDQWAVEYYTGNAWKEIHRVDVRIDVPALLGLGRDGKSVVLRLPGETEAGSYYELSPDGVLSAALVEDAGSRRPVFHPVSLRLLGFTHDKDWPQYELSDPDAKALAVRAQAAVPGYRMRLDGLCQDPNIAIVYSEGEDDSGTWYYINFATGQTTEIGAAYPELDPSFIAPVQALNYPATDGTMIEAFLTLPPGKTAKGLPLMILAHGRGLSSVDHRMGAPGQDELRIDWMAQALAAAGYAVLQPNYRGSTGYGDAFLAAGNAQWGRNIQTDVSAGVARLIADGTVDASRVGIAGCDTGGHIALSGVSLQNGIYRCAASIGGYSDISGYVATQTISIGTQSPTYRFLTRMFGESYDDISPLQHASTVSVPVFLAHSQDDAEVPYQQSAKMANALRGAGKDVTFVTTKATDDWKAQAAWRTDVMEPLLAFLARTNPA